MRNLLIITTLLVSSTWSVFAISGTCSWHGGVDCSQGADWDGSAICNDGWRDSTEMYSSVVACKNEKHSCNLEEWRLISAKYNLEDQQNKINELSQKSYESYTSSGIGETSSFAGGQAQNELRLNALKSINSANEIIRLQNKWKSDFNIAQRECDSLGEQKYLEMVVELYKKQSDYYNNLKNTQVIQSPVVVTNSNQNVICPENAEAVNGKCQCDKYSMFDGSNCIRKKEVVTKKNIEEVIESKPVKVGSLLKKEENIISASDKSSSSVPFTNLVTKTNQIRVESPAKTESPIKRFLSKFKFW